MKKALLLGSTFAARMGDVKASNRYFNAMVKLNSTLFHDHWNGVYVLEAVERAMVHLSGFVYFYIVLMSF